MNRIGKVIAVHSWNGHRIEIRVRSAARFLWMAQGFCVRIDDGEFFSPPGRLEWGKSATKFSISAGNQIWDGKVETVPGIGNKTVLRTLYRLSVGNDQIAEGVLRAENWYFTFGLLGVVSVVLFWVAIWLRPTS